MDNFLRYLIENQYLRVCRLISADRFISLCREVGINIDEKRLAVFERLAIFHPFARTRHPKVRRKIRYLDESRNAHNILDILKEGEEWTGDTKEEFAGFTFEKDYALSWLAEGILWDPHSRPYEPPIQTLDEYGMREINTWYSQFQVLGIKEAFDVMGSVNVALEDWLDAGEPEILKRGKEISDWASHMLNSGRARRERLDQIAKVCQVISNRYYPKTQTDLRTIPVPDFYDWKWIDCCRSWNAKTVLKDLGLTKEEIQSHRDFVRMQASFIDPLRDWHDLVLFVSREKKARLKGEALLAQRLYCMERMLGFFCSELQGQTLSLLEDSAIYGGPENLLGYLEYLTNDYHLNPKPNMILFVEGDGELEQLPRLAEEVFDHSFTRLGIEIRNLQGVGGFTGKKGADRYGALEKLIEEHHYRQILVFVVLDNEGRVRNIKKKLTERQSQYSPKRKLTKDEYIHIWSKNIEFDNFSNWEIAQALTKLCKGAFAFSEDEISEVSGDFVRLGRLFENRTFQAISKRELLRALCDEVINNAEKEITKKPIRPLLELLKKILLLAAHNFQPSRPGSWSQNQEPGFLG